MDSIKILIVEDEAEIADSVTFAIERSGMQAFWVDTGAKALEMLVSESPDLIIMDVGLPDITGFDLIKKVRENYSTPVIFLTARSEEIDRIIGLEIGADDYVTKPFSPRELVSRVKVILKRVTTNHEPRESLENKPQASPTDQTQSIFHIDHEQQIAKLHDTALILTKSEFLLLAALSEQPKRVFSRRQLIEKVWSSQHPSDDRAIDTHVKTLRAKLKAVDSADFIITHRGFGYSLSI